MMRATRKPRLALAALAGLLLPLAAAAQEREAWVLPRGLLEVGAGGGYTHWDRRLGWGDGPLGAELLPAYDAAVDRVLGVPLAGVRTGLAELFAAFPGEGAPPSEVTVGRPALTLAADLREAPFSLRYGATERVTLFAGVSLERRGTSVTELYLAGADLGLNPAQGENRAVLEGLDPRFGDLGGGALLPVAGSPAGVALQARLRAAGAEDTLRLPAVPVRLADLVEQPAFRALLDDEEAAAMTLRGGRRPYAFGDLHLGARVLLLRGPAGWPYAAEGGRGVRAVAGIRGRLPTGRGGTTFLLEIPGGGGHAGVGAELRADVYPGGRWLVHAGAAVDHLFPAEVPALAFSPTRPFPADTALRTVRRAPGRRLEATVGPQWRLTDDILFEGSYGVEARARTTFGPTRGGTEDETVLPSPLEWRTGGSVHTLGVGVRYSTLQAYGRGTTDWPFELSLVFGTAVAGAGHAPDATTLRVTGRIFVQPRRLAALLPGGGGDEAPPVPTSDPVPPTPTPAPEAPADGAVEAPEPAARPETPPR